MAGINTSQLTGSGFNAKAIIEGIIQAEKKKIEPVLVRKKEKEAELDTWKQVKGLLGGIKTTAIDISKRGMWDGKIVTSTHPDIVSVVGSTGAKPGKHTLIVDKLALNHQIASQSYKAKDTIVGQGTIRIKIGDGEEQTIIIDDNSDTLQGVKDAINGADFDLNASVIQTGNKDKPFQLVLTSKKTGQEGAIQVNFDFKARDVDNIPTFKPFFSEPSKWKGIDQVKKESKSVSSSGASTVVAEFLGTYTGEEPLDIKFTAVSSGIVGVTENLQLRWEDNQGRFGYINLDPFNYAPGEPIDVVDGISMALSEGEIVVNDSFNVTAKPEDSSLLWWVPDDERPAKISQPSSWDRQSTVGAPEVTGTFTGEEDDKYNLRVVGGGEVGTDNELKIEYESENGKRGTLFIGRGYKPGSKLSIGDGIEFSIQKGILQEGDFSSFEVQGGNAENFWWLSEQTRGDVGKIENVSPWETPEKDEEDGTVRAAAKKSIVPKISTASREIIGDYTDFEPKSYTFRVDGTGAVGVAKDLKLNWTDDKGNSGSVNVGEGYVPGTGAAFDSGLSVVLGPGKVFDTDSFSFRTFTSVIQPPQDAEIRLGATAHGGGLTVTSPTNTVDNVIEGVKLNLLNTSEEVITINVKGDTEKAIGGVKKFVEDINILLLFMKDSLKYNKDTKESGALQGDRSLPRIQQSISNILISTIDGLDIDRNLLFNVGIRFDDTGLLTLDEEKLNSVINDDFSKISNLFKSHGEIDNTAISYLTSNEKTMVSGSKGFDIDVTKAATKGFFLSRPILGPVTINDNNRDISMSINGRKSGDIQLTKGTYTIDQFASEIERQMTNDKKIGKLRFRVLVEGNKIKIRSGSYGTRSKVDITSPIGENLNSFPLAKGETIIGENAEGTVNKIQMKGSGQILAGKKGTDLEGLKLFTTLSEKQISKGIEGNIIFSKGVGTKLAEYITEILDEQKGAVKIYTKNVEDQYSGYKKQIKKFENRIEDKRLKLNTKFARVEAKIGQLKSEQNYLSSQLAKI